MERLTKRFPSGVSDYNYSQNCYFDDGSGPDRMAQSAFRQRCIGRLADYKDAGLTPELMQETAELAIWIHENGLEKIKEWIKADKDGRVVVLPSNKALTNADRIRAATNQQLAKLLYDNQKEFCRLMYKNLGFEDELNFSEDYSDILAWLNAPSKEAEKALEAMKDD